GLGHALLFRGRLSPGPGERMSWRITVSRAVAAAQQTTPSRRSAPARDSGPHTAPHAEPARSETSAAARARARTLPRIRAMDTLTDYRRVTAPARPMLTLVHLASFGPLDRQHLGRR